MKATESSGAQQRPSVVNTVAVTDSDHEIGVVRSTDKMESSQAADGGEVLWWEKLFRKKQSGAEHDV